MVARKIAVLCLGIFCAAALLQAQTVEKSSVSFSFPTTITSSAGYPVGPVALSFFRIASRSVQKGKISLEWNVGSSAAHGTISIYSVSGALVKRANVTANRGTWQCNLGKTGSGIYLASISFGQYRQNLKLALYR